MDEKKIVKLIYASIAFVILMLGLLVLFNIFRPSDLLEKNFSLSFNHPERVNSLLNNQLRNLIFIGIFALLILLGIRYSRLIPLNKFSLKLEAFILKVLSFKSLFTAIIIYLFVLFFLAISRYDLGIDEAVYPLFAKHFWTSGFAYSIYNSKINMVDNFTMLPLYIASVINFVLNLTDVWHFKLLASLLSLATIYIISRISFKLYNCVVS